jgi:hypothetical protein
MPRPSHSWLDRSNYTWRRLQVMKPLIMQFSSTSCHFIPPRSRYSPQYPVLSSWTSYETYRLWNTSLLVSVHPLCKRF